MRLLSRKLGEPLRRGIEGLRAYDRDREDTDLEQDLQRCKRLKVRQRNGPNARPTCHRLHGSSASLSRVSESLLCLGRRQKLLNPWLHNAT